MKYHYSQIKKLFLVGKQNPRIIMELAEDDDILVADGNVILRLPRNHKLFANVPYANNLPTEVGLPREFRDIYLPDRIPYKDLADAHSLLSGLIPPLSDDDITLTDSRVTVSNLYMRTRVLVNKYSTEESVMVGINEAYLECMFSGAYVTDDVWMTTKIPDGKSPVTISSQGRVLFFLMPMTPGTLDRLHDLTREKVAA